MLSVRDLHRTISTSEVINDILFLPIFEICGNSLEAAKLEKYKMNGNFHSKGGKGVCVKISVIFLIK